MNMNKTTKKTIIVWLIVYAIFSAFLCLTATGQTTCYYTPYLTVSGSSDTLFEEQWETDTFHRWNDTYMDWNKSLWKLCKSIDLDLDTSIIYDNVKYPMAFIIKDSSGGWKVYSWMNEGSTDNPIHDMRNSIYVKKQTRYQLRRYLFYTIIWQRSTGCFWDY
jgi:hypothetical protein